MLPTSHVKPNFAIPLLVAQAVELAKNEGLQIDYATSLLSIDETTLRAFKTWTKEHADFVNRSPTLTAIVKVVNAGNNPLLSSQLELQTRQHILTHSIIPPKLKKPFY